MMAIPMSSLCESAGISQANVSHHMVRQVRHRFGGTARLALSWEAIEQSKALKVR